MTGRVTTARALGEPRDIQFNQEKIVFAIALAMFAGFSVLLHGFLTAGNIISLVQSVSILGVLGIGMAVTIIGRGIDLSMVANMAVSVAWLLYLANHGAPLPVVKCITSELRVPADAEIVIEGRVLPQVREFEGPFGEFPQYYGERAKRHVIEVVAVTQRKDAMFHTIVGGGLEHLLLGGIPREATLLAHLRRSFPNVRDVHLARGGVCRYHLYVQIAKRQEGEAKNIMMGAFAGHYDVKHVIVVDEDVDIHNPAEVEWAVATRFQADKDLLIVPESQGSKLDPSTRNGVGAKMGMDATKPLDAEEMKFKRIRVPGEENVDLAKVVGSLPAPAWRRALGQ